MSNQVHIISVQKLQPSAISLPDEETSAGIYRIRSLGEVIYLNPGSNAVRTGLSITPPHGYRFLVAGAGVIESRCCITAMTCHNRGELIIYITNLTPSIISISPATPIAELNLISIIQRTVREVYIA